MAMSFMTELAPVVLADWPTVKQARGSYGRAACPIPTMLHFGLDDIGIRPCHALGQR